MQKTKNADQVNIEFEDGSRNAFADLGLENADELFARAKLGFHVHQLLASRKLKQREVASLLCVKQPEVSHLMNGHFSRFTVERLLEFLKGLDQTVTIRIRPHRPGEPYQEVGFGM